MAISITSADEDTEKFKELCQSLKEGKSVEEIRKAAVESFGQEAVSGAIGKRQITDEQIQLAQSKCAELLEA